MKNARLAAHIKKLRDADELVRARDTLFDENGRPRNEVFPLVDHHNPIRQQLANGAMAAVNVRYHADAAEEDFLRFAALGYELRIIPREVIDFHWFGKSLSEFKRIQITGWASMYTGWDALEELGAVTSLVVEGNPPYPLQLDKLPHLRELSISGVNLLSATTNSGLRALSMGFGKIPRQLRLDAPLERLSMGVKGDDVDLAFLTDPTELRFIAISGASSVSLRQLASSQRLERVDLTDCAELRDAGTLVGLKSLDRVEFDSVRSVVDLESMVNLRVKTRIYIARNYAFDPDFVSRAGGREAGWFVEKYRGVSKQMGAKGLPQLTAPFFVQSYAVTQFQVIFDDWDGYVSGFKLGELPDAELSDQLDYIARSVLVADAPELLSAEGVYFDSDPETMRVVVPDEPVAMKIASTLAGAWRSQARIRQLARQTPAD